MSKRTDEIDIPAQLLNEALAQTGGKRALTYNVQETVLATIAQRVTHVLATDPSVIALARLQAVVVAQIEYATEVALPPAQFDQFDLAVIEAPQSRALARRWLVEAHAALNDGGTLYVGGMNDGGIRSLIDDAAALFGNAHTLLSKRHGRVARLFKQDATPAPHWASEPGIGLGTWYGFEAELHDRSYRIESLPGVFAYDRIDAATRLLLEQIGDVRGARVLDIGCGYGIIGLTLAQRGAALADMLDENWYAVAAARRNAAAYGLANVRVEAADARTAPFLGPYDLVVTNPPFHRGKQIEYQAAHAFIAAARSMLAPSGRLVVVANNFIRYDTAMHEHFDEVKPIAQTPSFKLWQATYNSVK